MVRATRMNVNQPLSTGGDSLRFWPFALVPSVSFLVQSGRNISEVSQALKS